METALGLRRLFDFGIADKAGALQNLNGTDLKKKPLFLSGGVLFLDAIAIPPGE